MAVLLLALLTALWGINWPIMKIGLEQIPPFVFRTAASLAGAAVLDMTLWNVLTKAARPVRRSCCWQHCAGTGHGTAPPVPDAARRG